MRWWVVMAMLAVTATARAETVAPPRPGTFVVVIDRALPADKLLAATSAIGEALDQLEPEKMVAIVAAGSAATVLVAPTRAGNKKTIASRLERLRTSKTGDVLAGIRAAGNIIQKARDHDAHVLVITDGDELLAVGPTIEKIRRYGSVSALGYQSLNRITLQSIAHYGGGELHLVNDEGGVINAILDETVDPAARELAVVLVLDRSGSMQGPKLAMVKEMARVGMEVLESSDTIGVVAFDSESSVVVPPQRASDRMRISNEIARITSGGGTNVLPALVQARDMIAGLPRNVIKHVIVLSDGESPPDGVIALVDEMRAAKIIVSAIGIEGADRELLDAIAEHGQGRLYIGTDLAQLPKLFMSTVGRYPTRNR